MTQSYLVQPKKWLTAILLNMVTDKIPQPNKNKTNNLAESKDSSPVQVKTWVHYKNVRKNSQWRSLSNKLKMLIFWPVRLFSTKTTVKMTILRKKLEKINLSLICNCSKVSIKLRILLLVFPWRLKLTHSSSTNLRPSLHFLVLLLIFFKTKIKSNRKVRREGALICPH